jgi:hypothetical protein
MSDSPASILFNVDGYEVTVQEGFSVPAEQSGVPGAGVDDSGYARLFKVEPDGSITVYKAIRTQRFDVVSNTLTYLGKAEVGAAEADAVWTITELVTTPSGDPVSAKVALNVAWTNRASATYL